MLFDDISQTHSAGKPYPPPPMRKAESAMEAFAELHASFWDDPALGGIDRPPDEKSVAENVANTREHFPRFADALGSRLSHDHRRVYDRALSALPRLWTRAVSGKNLTLIHGDANFSNVLLPHDPETGKALVIDWQLYGISFSAEDLVHMIALFWNREQRQAMERPLLERYHEGLIRHGVRGYAWPDCWYDYRLAIVVRVLFMPMWFWVSGSPESWWYGCFGRAMEAVEDLQCLELMDTQ